VPRGADPEILPAADAGLATALAGADRVFAGLVGDRGAEVLALAAGGRRWTVPADPRGLGPLAAWLRNPQAPKVTRDAKALARAVLAAGATLRGVVLDVRLADGLLDLRDARGEAAGADATAVLDDLEGRTSPLEARLKADGLDTLLRDVELPVAPVLAAMEGRGIRLDRGVLETVEGEIAGRLTELKAQVAKEAGPDFNPLSPRQVGDLLFTKLNLPAKRKTKTGYSTDEAVLDELAVLHPVPGLVLEIRKLSKLLGTYLQPLPALVGADGMLHTTFHQLGAATGRISSSDPNLQNIPVRGPMGKRIRSAFVARSREWRLLSADYSQVELRILAHVAADPAFLEAFKRGEDIHAATAADMFSRPAAEVTPDQRRAAKAVNFGIMYGMTAFGLSRELKCDPGTAREYLDRYFLVHPAVKAYWDRTLAEARERGYAATLFGRRRPLPELASANKVRREEAEREAINHPIQGTAADVMKLAIAAAARAVPDACLLLTIHDELLFEVPRGREQELAAAVTAAMEGVHPFAAPLRVDASWGDSWAECHG
jgi:DNA polymerase-1